MKIKIVSKGAPSNTYVVNAATGEPIENVSSILWVRHTDGRVYAEIKVEAAAADVVAETAPVKVSEPKRRSDK